MAHEPSVNGVGIMEITLHPVKFTLSGGKSFDMEVLDTAWELEEIRDKIVAENEHKPDEDKLTNRDYLRRVRDYLKTKTGLEITLSQADEIEFNVKRIHAEAKKKQQDFWVGYAKSQTSTESTPSENA